MAANGKARVSWNMSSLLLRRHINLYSGEEPSSIMYQYLPFFALCFAELITMCPIAFI